MDYSVSHFWCLCHLFMSALKRVPLFSFQPKTSDILTLFFILAHTQFWEQEIECKRGYNKKRIKWKVVQLRNHCNGHKNTFMLSTKSSRVGVIGDLYLINWTEPLVWNGFISAPQTFSRPTFVVKLDDVRSFVVKNFGWLQQFSLPVRKMGTAISRYHRDDQLKSVCI